jgi:hypothetical protein
MGILSLPARRWGRIGLVALLGLTMALVTLTASRASASTWHKVGATTAKKKCKKKHKSAASAKKKKCKKKRHVIPPAPVTPPRGPIDRIVLTWSGAADLDAHAWSSGLHDGWNETLGTDGEYEVQIPGTTYTASFQTPNRETIVETNPNPNIRPMTFGICYYAGPGETDSGDTDLTVNTVFSNGERTTDSFSVSFGDALVDNRAEGGPADPAGDWCPTPF